MAAKLLHSIEEALDILSLGRTKFYEEINLKISVGGVQSGCSSCRLRVS